MKVLLDEAVPRRVGRRLIGHDISTVVDVGWASIKNGRLLALIEQADYEVFVTCDKSMEYQQSHLDRRRFGVLVLSTNHWESMEAEVAKVLEAVNTCEAGTVRKVECGRFVPARFRKPSI